MSTSFAISSWRKCFLASLSTTNHLLEGVISYPIIEIVIIEIGQRRSANLIEYVDLNPCIKISVMVTGYICFVCIEN